MDKKQKDKISKKGRRIGKAFENRARKDMEDKGWICDKWTNNVDLKENKIIPAKPHMMFNHIIKRMIPLQTGSGFPDFICFKFYKGYDGIKTYEVIGVEAKTGGKLKKIEKDKCEWLLKNHIFGKILVASKHKEGRMVVVKYEEVFR